MGFKVIYPEKQGAPSASIADASYPASNLTDNKVNQKGWYAVSGVDEAILRCPVDSDATDQADGCGLTATNAESAQVAVTLDSAEKALTDSQPAVDLGGGLVKIPCAGHGMIAGDVAVINGTDNYDGIHTLPSQALGNADNLVITATYAAETFSSSDTAAKAFSSAAYTLKTSTRSYRQLWHEYTAQSTSHTVTIALAAASGETVYAGIFRAGPMIHLLQNPDYGITRKPDDKSIYKEYDDGSMYARLRTIRREYAVDLKTRDEDKLEDLFDLYHAIGQTAVMMLLADGINDLKWTCFGHIIGLSGSYNCNQQALGFTVREAV